MPEIGGVLTGWLPISSVGRWRACGLIAALPAQDWRTTSAGAGRQGPHRYDWIRVPLPYAGKSDQAQWRLARRSLSYPSEVAYFRSAGPKETTLATLVQVAGRRWTIEEGFQRAKGLVGLDHYEMRKWHAWYRHVTLALLAHAYLKITRSRSDATTGQSEAQKRGLMRHCCR